MGVAAFRQDYSSRHQIWNARNLQRFPLPPPSVQRLPLFFSDQDNLMKIPTNSKRTKPHVSQFPLQNVRNGKYHYPLFANNKDCESGSPFDNDSTESGKKNRLPSMKRIGGRIRKGSLPKDDAINFEKSPPSKRKLPSGSFLVVVLLVLTLLKNLLFGGGMDSDNYYYYSYSSSSVYETRVNPDGSRTTTETSRKESSDLKTNIPGLTDKDFLDRSSNRGRVFTDYFYFEE